MTDWSTHDIPDQSGRIAIVTGANSGLGYEVSLALARKNAQVIMACRSPDKAIAARDSLVQQAPGAKLTILELDLGSQASIHEFADAYRKDFAQLDLLVNNAGLMAPPYAKTRDGFEMQFGVNHLGHFTLTGLLLNLMLHTPGSRVVTVSSNGAYFGWIDFKNLNGERYYQRYIAYVQSKLANVLFAFELQRRLAAAQAETLSLAAQPGICHTRLQVRTVQESGSALEGITYRLFMPLVAQSAERGALSLLFPATSEGVRTDRMYEPRYFHTRGDPVASRAPRLAYNQRNARRLWEVSEQMTGVRYPLPGG